MPSSCEMEKKQNLEVSGMAALASYAAVLALVETFTVTERLRSFVSRFSVQLLDGILDDQKPSCRVN